LGSPGHAPRYDRGIGSVAVRMRSVLQTTTGPCPSPLQQLKGSVRKALNPKQAYNMVPGKIPITCKHPVVHLFFGRVSDRVRIKSERSSIC
jgi:hypothetical protein